MGVRYLCSQSCKCSYEIQYVLYASQSVQHVLFHLHYTFILR